MKGTNPSPRLEDVPSYRAMYPSVQKDICIPRMRETLFRIGEFLQRDGCEDVRTEMHQEAKSNSTALSMFGLLCNAPTITARCIFGNIVVT